MERCPELRRHVGEALVGNCLLRRRDRRSEEDIEDAVLLLVIEAHTSRQVYALRQRDDTLSKQANSDVVEFGLR